MKNFISIKPLFIFYIFFLLLSIIKTENTPLSSCTKGRITTYNGWQNGGSCGLGVNPTTINSKIFAASPNEKLFLNSQQCGVCYEMVGPYGAIKVRVEDYCSKNSKYCSGDMNHFNIANTGSSYIMGSADLSNITFRMVSCDYQGNIRILTASNVQEMYLSFIILEHNLAVSFVEIFQYKTNSWKNMTRNGNNWINYDLNKEIQYPLKIRIYSINGDYVTGTINNLEKNKYYEADGNFIIPENTYFDVTTLKKVYTNNIEKNKCCEIDKSEFTPIYKDSQINSWYNAIQSGVIVDFNSINTYQSRYSIEAKFQKFGNLTFKPSFPIRADQYKGIYFSMKLNSYSYEYLYVKLYDIDDNLLSVNYFNGGNAWKNYTISFDKITNNEFNGIIFHYNGGDTLEVLLENIGLISNPNAPYAGICYNNSTEKTNNPEVIDSASSLKINIYQNATDILNIYYPRHNSINDILHITLTSENGEKKIEVNNCTSPKIISNISLFTACTLPKNIEDGIYIINSTYMNGNYTYYKKIEIKNGLIICGNIVSSTEDYYSIINIIYSQEKIINKGDKIEFSIYPIPQEKYYIENEEIILLNDKNDKSLNLKLCNPNIENKNVVSIQCTVSNNIMKANFTKLYTSQKVYLLNGQNIKLINLNPSGGMLSSSYTKNIDTYISASEKKNLNFTFNVLYYNSNIKPGDEFPHKVYLKGYKKNKRKLEEKIYDLEIRFENCSAGEYSSQDILAIGSIICKVPDNVQAGNYEKLESDGIDVNPQYSININFENDFNRSAPSNYINIGANNESEIIHEESSSSSKNWIIWVVVIVALMFILGIIIIIIACRKEDEKEEDTTVKKGTNGSTTQNISM